MLSEDLTSGPPIEAVRALRASLRDWLPETPVMRCRNLEDRYGLNAEVWGKLEFLQQTGTFKPRGALSVILEFSTGYCCRSEAYPEREAVSPWIVQVHTE